MSPMVWRYGLVVTAYCLFTPAEVSAGKVVVTWGDTISHVGDVSASTGQSQGINKVGYKYSYFGVFWLNLWTWGGSYCVYEGDRYGEIQPAEAATLLGVSADKLSPLWYRYPAGLLVVTLLNTFGFVTCVVSEMMIEARKTRHIIQLSLNPQYQRALEILETEHAKLAPPVGPDGAAPETTTAIAPEERFRVALEAGVQYLVSRGVDREDARRNLGLWAQAHIKPHQRQAKGNGRIHQRLPNLALKRTPHHPRRFPCYHRSLGGAGPLSWREKGTEEVEGETGTQLVDRETEAWLVSRFRNTSCVPVSSPL